MAGAAALAGRAALRSGAGLVTVAAPDCCADVVAQFEPAMMTRPFASDRAGRLSSASWRQLFQELRSADVIAVGPGLGRSRSLTMMVERLFRSAPCPVVIDADGLNALADARVFDQTPADDSTLPAAARVLTPHPGEFAGLTGIPAAERVEQCRRADELAALWKMVIVLKGHGTWVTDGNQSIANSTGNPGMATGGSGDVLTGVVAAQLAVADPFMAARTATWVHGHAGDLAAQASGQTSLTASDLIDYLPAAFMGLDPA
jgi:NAD(P)H-hydrate epimerase